MAVTWFNHQIDCTSNLAVRKTAIKKDYMSVIQYSVVVKTNLLSILCVQR